MKKAICFGEILWDIFPDNKKIIGGAPLNVAFRLQSLGIETKIISRVGKDTNGSEIIDIVKKQEINPSLIQVGEERTGEVTVSLEEGIASYTIEENAAWDFIQITDDNKAQVSKADIFIFGSLVTRNSVSKQTLLSLIESANFKVFDVNLRSPFYEYNLLLSFMEKADFIKFNDDELFEICENLESPYHSIEQNILFISKKTNTSQICVTKGKYGAILFIDGAFYTHSGFKVSLKDSVGAGDSFLGTLLANIITNQPPQQALEKACGMGALVASKAGANPTINDIELNNLINP